MTTKLNYSQYKQITDAFVNGNCECLPERLYLSDDNVLYFTKNANKKCEIPLGLNPVANSLQMENITNKISEINMTIRDAFNCTLQAIFYIMQNYNPYTYHIYHDSEYLKDYGNSFITYVSSSSQLKDVYEKSLKEDRFINNPFSIFIFSHRLLIETFNEITNETDLANSGALLINRCDKDSLVLDYLEPNVTRDDVKYEISTFFNMLDRYQELITDNSFVYDVITPSKNPHELNVVINRDFKATIRREGKSFIMIQDGENITPFMEDFQTLYLIERKEPDFVDYIFRCNFYMLFSRYNNKISPHLLNLEDFSDNDKELIDKFLKQEADCYLPKTKPLGLRLPKKPINKVYYDVPNFKLELKDNKALVTIGDEIKELPKELCYGIPKDLLEQIVTYEILNEYKFRLPEELNPFNLITDYRLKYLNPKFLETFN